MKKTIYFVAAILAGAMLVSCEKGSTPDDGTVKISEPANSFVVAPGSKVSFPAEKGNSGGASGAVSFKLLWQDNAGLVSGEIEAKDGKAVVTFAPEKEGNAVVAGLDASGNVVWSWHLWVVKDAPQDVTVAGYTFMDRNIGALTTDEKSELSVGMTYQYGRKDPFPGMKFTAKELREMYDASGDVVRVSIVENQNADNIATTIANPTVFYNHKYVGGTPNAHAYSWLTLDATTYGADNFKALWENGGVKTMYDPCPAGYQVAPAAAWTAVASTTRTELWDNDYVSYLDDSFGTNQYSYGYRKKAQFRGCAYGDLKLTIAGEVNSNSAAFTYANHFGSNNPIAEVWCADIDPGYTNSASYFRGTAAKISVSGTSKLVDGNPDLSAITVGALSSANKFTLIYLLPVRCVKESK